MLHCFFVRLDSAHFASQQRGDPDFTDAEKRSMAEALLAKSPAAFLARFGKSMGEPQLAFFERQYSNGDNNEVKKYTMNCFFNKLSYYL